MLKLNPKHKTTTISSGHMTTKPVRNTIIRLVMIFVLTTALGFSATAYNITTSVYAEEEEGEEEQAVATESEEQTEEQAVATESEEQTEEQAVATESEEQTEEQAVATESEEQTEERVYAAASGSTPEQTLEDICKISCKATAGWGTAAGCFYAGGPITLGCGGAFFAGAAAGFSCDSFCSNVHNAYNDLMFSLVSQGWTYDGNVFTSPDRIGPNSTLSYYHW
jgi:hypothetical protein